MSNTDAKPPEQVVREVVAWENGDPSKRDRLSESIDVYNPGLPGGEVHGRDAWEAYLRDVKRGFPDFRITVVDSIADGNLVMNEERISGTHEGEFKGIPPTGNEVEIRGMNRFVVEDGQVTEWYSYYDTAELQAQLGLTFPAVLGQLPALALGKLRSNR